jgi:hypothetical protein
LEDLGQMKYLERVVKEAMRLYPPVSIIGRQLSEDIVIGEKTICLMIWKIPLNLKKGKRKAFINPFTEDFDAPKRKC